MVFNYDELSLLTVDQFIRIAALDIRIPKIIVEVNNAFSVSFLDVLYLLEQNQELILHKYLERCNYKLDRTVFDAYSVVQYLIARINMSFDSNFLMSENSIASYKSKSITDFESHFVSLDEYYYYYNSVNADVDLSYNPKSVLSLLIKDEKLLLTEPEYEKLDAIIIMDTARLRQNINYKSKDAFVFTFINLVVDLSLNRHKFLNQKLELCNYILDRNTFDACSVNRYIDMKKHRNIDTVILYLY